MNIFFIYGIIMLFTGLIAFHVTNSMILKKQEGLTPPSKNSSSVAATAPNSSNNAQPPVPAEPAETKKSGGTKVSACGDDCSVYDEINKTLETFNKLNTKQQLSDDAVKKVDKDLIQLSKNVKNMGSKKTPGGKPPINKKMLS